MYLNKKIFFIILIFSLAGCKNRDTGKLLIIQEKPGKGFNYPYYLFIPDEASIENEIPLVVEPNNSGFVSDSLQEHIEKARRTAKNDYYMGNYIARSLGAALVVPVFPRSETNWKIYTHSLDRDAVLLMDHPLERIDLQLLNMVEDAREKLDSMGYRIKEKFLLSGFSASGTFANRFTLIHPEHVLAMAAGGLNGLLMLPRDSLEGSALIYPVGVHDFKEIFGKEFNFNDFKEVPQFLFMGEEDENDAIPYDDGYEEPERSIIYEVLGQHMMPARWESCKEVYQDLGINAVIKTYPETGHEHPDKIKQEILEFFTRSIN